MILILNILFRQMYLSKSEFHSFENSIEASKDILVNGVGIKRDCCASTSFSSVQWLSHVQLFATPWTATHQSSLSMTNSEFTQTHVHWVGHAIQPSQPLSSPSLPASNLFQHQSLFQWVSSSHQVAKVLEFQLQHQSFQWTPRTNLLQDGLVGSPCSSMDSQESSPTPQFKRINSSGLSFLYSPSLTSIHDYWKNHSYD